MSHFRSCLAVGAALCLSSAAHAVVIDFNDLHHTGQVVQYVSVTEGDYKFTCNITASLGCFGVIGETFPNQRYTIDPAGAALKVSYPKETTTLARVDGTAFDFVSIDLADYTNDGSSVVMSFTFNYASGAASFTKSVQLDTLIGGQTVTFNQTGLSSVSFYAPGSSLASEYQFDNVVVTSAVAAVPEPASYALMALGLLSLGAIAKRRKG